MAVYRVTAIITLEFNSEDGLVTSSQQAFEEMNEFLSSGNASDFDITVETYEEE